MKIKKKTDEIKKNNLEPLGHNEQQTISDNSLETQRVSKTGWLISSLNIGKLTHKKQTPAPPAQASAPVSVVFNNSSQTPSIELIRQSKDSTHTSNEATELKPETKEERSHSYRPNYIIKSILGYKNHRLKSESKKASESESENENEASDKKQSNRESNEIRSNSSLSGFLKPHFPSLHKSDSELNLNSVVYRINKKEDDISDKMSNKSAGKSRPATNITALNSMKSMFDAEFVDQFVFDYSRNLPDQVERKIENVENKSEETPKQPEAVKPKERDSTDASRRFKAEEYYKIEENQARLLTVLYKKVYEKFKEENKKQQHTICDEENMNKIFGILAELGPMGELVHVAMGNEVKKRVEQEWNEKPYFGDLIVKNCPYYKIYKSVNNRIRSSLEGLMEMEKKKSFSNLLKKLLVNNFDFFFVSLEILNRSGKLYIFLTIFSLV